MRRYYRAVLRALGLIASDTDVKHCDEADWQETIAGIRESMAEFELGKGRPAAEVFEDIRRKYDIP